MLMSLMNEIHMQVKIIHFLRYVKHAYGDGASELQEGFTCLMSFRRALREYNRPIIFNEYMITNVEAEICSLSLDANDVIFSVACSSSICGVLSCRRVKLALSYKH